MKKILSVMIASVACSSASTDAADECPIEGSYSATGSQTSGNCPSSDAPATYTITARAPGATGPDFKLEIQGLSGACSLNRVAGSTCKVQGKCDATVTDALDPNNALGTAQFSWTFDKAGFTGTSTVVAPPAEALPDGCSGQATVTGARQ